MRSLVLLALLAGSACSTTEPDGADASPTLRTLWAAGTPTNSSQSLQKGSVDAKRFYADRGRAGGGLVAYDRRTGAEAWRQTAAGPCTVVPAGDRVYCPGDYLYALDAETGRELWRYGTGGVNDPFSLVDADADAATGERVWERTFTGPGWAGVLVDAVKVAPEGDLLVSFSGEYFLNGVSSAAVVAALDPATGEERWRVVDGGRETNRKGGDLVLVGDLVLYADFGGQEVVAVSRSRRAVAWRAPYTPGSFSGRRAPAVSGGRVYYTDTLGGVFAVDARTGAPVWSAERPGGFFTQLACGPVLYANDQRGALFDLDTGRHLGVLLADPEAIPGQAAAADGVLYLSASSGVYAFDCSP